MTADQRRIVPTDAPPADPSHEIGVRRPPLLMADFSSFCPGCGEPIAARALLENLVELDVAQRTIAVMGIGCYTGFSVSIDLETVQALHGRAPSVATGVKRMQPDTVVVTLQGDGDMVNEGLQEVLHTAARGESVTCDPAEQRRLRRDRRAHDGHERARAAHEELARRPRRRVPRLPDPASATCSRSSTASAYVARGSVHNAGAVGQDEEDGAQGARDTTRRARVLVRRDPDHVPDGLVHRRARRRGLHGRDPRPRPHHGRTQRRMTPQHESGVSRARSVCRTDAASIVRGIKVRFRPGRSPWR